MNFIVKYTLVKNIYVINAKDEVDAKQIADANILNLLNQITDSYEMLNDHMERTIEKTGD